MASFYASGVRESLRPATPSPSQRTVTVRRARLYRIVVPARLDIKLLGPVRVELDGAPLVVDTRKAIALLAYLAVTQRPTTREAVAALLWPESGDADARGAFRRTLSVLHSALGGVGLVVDRRTVELSPDAAVDLWRFQAAIARVRGHGHGPDAPPCPACLGELDAAVALDRGEFMAGFALRDCETFDEWHAEVADAHRRDLIGVLERLARGRVAGEAWDAAVAAGRRWLDLDPLHEPAHRLLMAALAGCGEPAAALRQYRDCVRVLDRELGVAPLAETTALAEAIRDGRIAPPSGRAADPPAAPAAAGRAMTPTHGPRTGPMVGRADELGALLEGLRAPGPDGRLLVVEGEAGIGKTRLGAALAEEARAGGGTVLAVEVPGGETSIAFGPVGELIRAGLRRPDAAAQLRAVPRDRLREVARLAPLPDVVPAPGPTALEDPFGRARLLDAIADVLGALAKGPSRGLLWFDDLHRADASTFELVAYLVHRLRERPIAVLITWRPEELAHGARERIVGAAERDGLVTRVDLRRLDETEVAALATATLGRTVDRGEAHVLFEHSEGLPLYVAEALAAPDRPVDQMPDGVVALIEARIDATSEIARQILSAAAVIGRSFDLGSVGAASGRTAEETVDGLDELVRRGLVREAGLSDLGDLRYDFTHGRLRDVTYDRLSLARRRLLHGRVAEALERGSVAVSPIGHWSLIAHHETLAGRTSKAAEAHRRAGDQARSVFANAEARAHLEAALALGHPAVSDLHEALGEVDMLLGDYDQALAHLETASGLAGPERTARLDHRLATVLARQGDLVRADRYLVASLAALDPEGDPGTRAEILVERGAIAQRQGDHERAEALARQALGLGEGGSDPVAIARAADLLGIVARSRGDLTAAREVLERAIVAVDLVESRAPTDGAAIGDPGLRVAALNTLALVYADAGDRERAIALTREALLRCERQGDRHRQAALENNLADLLHADGRPDEAMEHLKRAVALFAEIGGRPGVLRPDVWKLVEW